MIFKKSKNSSQNKLDRLRDLASRSIIFTGKKTPSRRETKEFVALFDECLREGIRFPGLRLSEHYDGCWLCVEERKAAVYDALTPGPKQPRRLQSIVIPI